MVEIYFIEQPKTKLLEAAFNAVEGFDDLNPIYLSPKETLSRYKDGVRDKASFILAYFEGPVFEHLRKFTNAIYGPQVILHYLRERLPLPTTEHPLYSVALYDAVVTLSSLNVEKRSEIFSRVLMMHGVATRDLTEDVNVLVAPKLGSKKYYVAGERKLHIMLPGWIDEAWHQSALQDPINFMSDLAFERHRMPVFYQLSICVSGFSVAERKEIGDLISSNGGSYSGEMRIGQTTHLVISKPQGAKYSFAKKWKLQIVNLNWVTDSVTRGFACPEKNFAVEDHQSTSTPSRPGPPQSLDSDQSSIAYSRSHVQESALSISDRSGFFSGCVFILLNCGQGSRSELRSMVEGAGGRFCDALEDQVSEEVTHCVVGDQLSSFRLIECESHVKYVTKSWIFECVKRKQRVPEAHFVYRVEKPDDLDAMETAQPKPTLQAEDFKLIQDYFSQADVVDLLATDSKALFHGVRFLLSRHLDSVTSDKLTAKLEAEGATVLDSAVIGAKIDYFVCPLTLSDNSEKAPASASMVTDAWVRYCLEKGEIDRAALDTVVGYRPYVVCTKPLKNCVLSPTGFSGALRNHLVAFVEALGGRVQETFVRRAMPLKGLLGCTHLLTHSAKGRKWEAARSWQLPAVSTAWLAACARADARVSEAPYLVQQPPSSANASVIETTVALQTERISEAETASMPAAPDTREARLSTNETFAERGTPGEGGQVHTGRVTWATDPRPSTNLAAAETIEIEQMSPVAAGRVTWADPRPSALIAAADTVALEDSLAPSGRFSGVSTRPSTNLAFGDTVALSESCMNPKATLAPPSTARRTAMAETVLLEKEAMPCVPSKACDGEQGDQMPDGRERCVPSETALCSPTSPKGDGPQPPKDDLLCTPGPGLDHTIAQLSDTPVEAFLAKGCIYRPTLAKEGIEQSMRTPDWVGKGPSLPDRTPAFMLTPESEKVDRYLGQVLAQMEGKGESPVARPFEKVALYVVGMLSSRRLEISKLVRELGGTFQWTYRVLSCTHVVSEVMGAEAEQAKRDSKAVVTLDWVKQSAAAKIRLPEADFKPLSVSSMPKENVLVSGSPSATPVRAADFTPLSRPVLEAPTYPVSAPLVASNALTDLSNNPRSANRARRQIRRRDNGANSPPISTADLMAHHNNENPDNFQNIQVRWKYDDSPLKDTHSAPLPIDCTRFGTSQSTLLEGHETRMSQQVKVIEPRVFFLSGLSPDERLRCSNIIRQLGGEVDESRAMVNSVTHLIAAAPARNEKFLICMAMGKWILHKSYVETCGTANKWLPEATFEWGGPGTEPLLAMQMSPGDRGSQHMREMAKAACYWRQSGGGAFRNWRAVFWPRDWVKVPSFTRIIECGGGTVMDADKADPATVTHAFIRVTSERSTSAPKNLKWLRVEYLSAVLSSAGTSPPVSDYYAFESQASRQSPPREAPPSKRIRV